MTKLDSDLIKQVQSFEDALAILEAKSPGIKNEFKEFSKLKGRFSNRFIAEFKLMVIAEALNDGWDPTKYQIGGKHYPYFIQLGDSEKCKFSTSTSGNGHPNPYIGSHLLLKNYELSTYIGLKFVDIYNEMLLG